MSYLSTTIGGLLARCKKSECEIAELARIDIAQFFRWRSSREILILPKELVRLARAFSLDKKDFVKTHADLLHASLMDQCHGPGAKFICLEVTPQPDWLITTSFGRVYVTPSVRRDLQAIHNLVWQNVEVRSRVRSLAKFCNTQDQQTRKSL